MTHNANARRRWPLALLSALAALLLAELALRLADWPQSSRSFPFLNPNRQIEDVFATGGERCVADPELFWTLEPNPLTRINRFGLRGWLPSRPKGADDFRVACIGDSITFGFGVFYENTYGMQLERLLQYGTWAVNVQTLLFGLPGYSTYQNRILFERHVADFRPDLTVILCGAWNDYQPAIGFSDAKRADRNRAPRLVQLVRQALAAEPSPRDLEAYAGGATPDGRRVPLVEFRQNVRSLIQGARELGSQVVLVVPAIPETTLRDFPVGGEYLDAVRDLGAELDVVTVDAGRVLEDYLRAHPDEAPRALDAPSPTFLDWIHPSGVAHAELARAIHGAFDLGPRRGGSALLEGPRIDSVEPGQASAFTRCGITLTGEGFAGAGHRVGFERLFFAGRWMNNVEVVDDSTVRFSVDLTLPPGPHMIELRTSQGPVRASREFEVLPPDPLPLTVRLSREEGPQRLVLDCEGAPRRGVIRVFFSPRRRKTPQVTPQGSFELATEGVELGPSGTALPVADLALFEVQGSVDARGAWHHEIELEKGAAPEWLGDAWAQGLVVNRFDRRLGALTRAVQVEDAR